MSALAALVPAPRSTLAPVDVAVLAVHASTRSTRVLTGGYQNISQHSLTTPIYNNKPLPSIAGAADSRSTTGRQQADSRPTGAGRAGAGSDHSPCRVRVSVPPHRRQAVHYSTYFCFSAVQENFSSAFSGTQTLTPLAASYGITATASLQAPIESTPAISSS